MALTNYRRGAEKERRLVKKLRDIGFIAARSAGSHSPIDVWAINPLTKQVCLFQCKLGKLGKKKAEGIRLEGARLDGLYTVTFFLDHTQGSHTRKD